MATELSQIIREVLELSDDERATLVGLLIESLDKDEEIDPDVEAAWAAEAERRWNEIESGDVKTVPWSRSKGKASEVPIFHHLPSPRRRYFHNCDSSPTATSRLLEPPNLESQPRAAIQK